MDEMLEQFLIEGRELVAQAGKDLAAVLQALEVSEATLARWRTAVTPGYVRFTLICALVFGGLAWLYVMLMTGATCIFIEAFSPATSIPVLQREGVTLAGASTAFHLAYLAAQRMDHDAVVPIQEDGRPQPLAALYRVDPCRQRATNLIEAGRRRPLDLLEAVKTRRVAFDELRNFARAQSFFVNINTPKDYSEAIRGFSL